MITVKEVKTAAQLRAFIEFPNRLYKDNPYFVPSLYADEKETLRKETNPSYDYCDARQFLAYKDGKLAGRICAIVNYAYIEKWGKKRIRFNRFDIIDDLEVTKALIGAVEQWGRELGLEEITGPIGYNDLDKQGLLVEGFEEMDLSITTYNYPYYADHLNALGFVKDADWIEMQITCPETMDPTVVKVANGILRRHNLRVLQGKTMKEVLPYAHQVFEVINLAYAGLYGVVPLTEKQIASVTKHFITMLNPDYCALVLDEHDKMLAFGIAIPSIAKASRKCGGHLFPLGWLYLLRALKKNTILELLLVGVRPEYRNWGLAAPIYAAVYDKAIENGILIAESGPELELNDKVQSTWKSFPTRQHRRRRCYVKPL